jgi:beta-N-acetylhexosaminidase
MAATTTLLAACVPPGSTQASGTPSEPAPTTDSPTPPPPTTQEPPTSAPPTTAPPTTTTPACTTDSVLSTWSVTRLAEQTVVIPVDENSVSSITQEIADGAGGVILFGSSAPSNLGTALKTLVGHAPGGIAPFIMTDEEGGAVQRMANLVGDIPSARQMAQTMTAAQIQALATSAAKKMKANGVTMDLAPVLDLDDRPGPSSTNPDGTRSFSKVEATAAADGIAFAKGLRAGGVIPVVKHFPGLGYATGNTDDMAASTVAWSTLKNDGLLPFTASVSAGLPAVMVANAKVPGLTTLPASISAIAINQVLRQQLGFDGLVITDSLSAAAISAAGYSVPNATVAALAAGADMILFNSSASTTASATKQIVAAIVAAVSSGKLSRARLQEAVEHILVAKHINLCG